jgi:hypothetical protein
MNSTNANAKQTNEYFEGQMWAKPNVDHLRQLMREVSKRKEGLGEIP